jgi:hypothetical protein
MFDLINNALKTNATSRTEKYFLNTEDGKTDIRNLITTIEQLVNADYSDSIIAHNGAAFDQTEYKMFGNLSLVWEASLVYPSQKDLLRRSNEMSGGMTVEKTTDTDTKPNEIEDSEGKVLTPIEFDVVLEKYNENQKEGNLLKACELSGFKGVEYSAFQAFMSDTSICQANVNGSIPPEVSIVLNYKNMLGKSAIIDEINEKAVQLWLLARA